MVRGRRGKYSRAQARARIRRTKRRKGSMGWTVATVMIVIVGVGAVALAKTASNSGAAPVVNKDHWHAYLGVDVCGQWLASAPSFDGLTAQAMGLHSHGDGLMHIHPFSSAAAGKNASVGRFLKDNDSATWSLSAGSMKLWDDATHRNGDACPTGPMQGKKAEIVWAVGHYGKPWDGKLRTGSPADFRPQNGDIVAIGFLPKGEKLPEPPDAQSALSNIGDIGGPAKSGVNGPKAPTAPGASTPSASTPSASTPSASTPSASTPSASTPSASSPPAAP